jgi:AcrR family transcriptional regulator
MAEAIAQQIIDKVTEKLSAVTADRVERVGQKTARRLSDKAERLTMKAAMQAEALERLAAHLDTIDVWTREEPAGRRPRFRREDIADAAVRIADTEGLDAVSMRRLATEMGAGTMTLYHYVRTKDELMTLVNDAVMSEVIVPEGESLPADWRDAVATIARRSRDTLLRHPWILDIADDPPVGPNSVRHFDQSLQAISSFPGSFVDKLDIVHAVDEYTFGFCLHERSNLHEDAAIEAELGSYIEELVASGEYPSLSILLVDRSVSDVMSEIHAHTRDPERFDRNLATLLDGFEHRAGRSGV